MKSNMTKKREPKNQKNKKDRINKPCVGFPTLTEEDTDSSDSFDSEEEIDDEAEDQKHPIQAPKAKSLTNNKHLLELKETLGKFFP